MIKALSGPAFTIPVSDEEKTSAKGLRDALNNVLKKQDKLFKYMEVFFGNLESLENSTGLIKISPIIKRYEHKMRKIFNEYIKEFSAALVVYQKNFADDSEMDEIRNLIIENIRNMRNAMIELLVLMKDVGSETFGAESLEKYAQIKNIGEKLNSLVREEWFGKIDFDILGKIRLGYDNPPLSIKG